MQMVIPLDRQYKVLEELCTSTAFRTVFFIVALPFSCCTIYKPDNQQHHTRMLPTTSIPELVQSPTFEPLKPAWLPALYITPWSIRAYNLCHTCKTTL